MKNANAQARLESPWAESVDPSSPLPEYPRPSLVRDPWLSLNGRWDYAIRPSGAGRPADAAAYDGPITVPYPVESALSGVGRPLKPTETLWYRRIVSVPKAFRGKRVLLHFGAVDWEARVEVNGRRVGSHRGGYAPFWFDITDALGTEASGELLVEVRDPTDAGAQCRGKQTLRPRGILYTAASGIWGSAWLEGVGESRIERIVAVVPAGAQARDGRLDLRVALSDAGGDGGRRLRALLKDGDRPVADVAVAVAAGASAASFELSLDSPRLWSPESPFLYGLELELRADPAAESVDRVASYAAFRTVAIGPDSRGIPRILLNGESYFNNAVLDQGYWPEGVYTAPTDEALVSDIALAKELGFNTIRKHAKVESERWYWHCDRLGMLVWQDIPSGGKAMRFLYSAALGFAGIRLRDDRRLTRFGRADPDCRADFEREAAEIYEYLEGFACIAAWVPFNEGWGQFESDRIAREFASRDPTRLVDAASGWYDNAGGHFASRHDYSRKPRAQRADGKRALSLSEYGGLTMRVAGHSSEDKRQFGYAGASDGGDLASQYEALAARLSSFAEDSLAAAVYTQISDVEIERNGLVTYDRRFVKADAARIRAANLALTAAGKAADDTMRDSKKTP